MNDPKKSSFTITITVILSLLIVAIMGIGVFVIFASINKKDPLDKYTTHQTVNRITFAEGPVGFSGAYKKFSISINKGLQQARALRIDNDQDLKELQKLSLNAVIIHGAEIDGKGLQYLTEIPTLTELTILDLSDVGKNIKYIGQIDNLKMLKIHSSFINDSWLEELANLKNLIVLDLTSNNISDKGLIALEKLPLKSVSISSDAITDKAVESLSKMKSLSFIQLSGNNLGPHLFEKLSKIKSLRSLEIAHMKASNATDLKYLTSMPLVNLSLGSVSENADSYSSALCLTPLPQSISTLRFTGVELSGKDMICLKNLPRLNTISFENIAIISNEVIESLLKLKPQVVVFRESGLKDKHLLMLTKLGSMSQICIPECFDLTQEAVADFRRNYKAIWKRECQLSYTYNGVR